MLRKLEAIDVECGFRAPSPAYLSARFRSDAAEKAKAAGEDTRGTASPATLLAQHPKEAQRQRLVKAKEAARRAWAAKQAEKIRRPVWPPMNSTTELLRRQRLRTRRR